MPPWLFLYFKNAIIISVRTFSLVVWAGPKLVDGGQVRGVQPPPAARSMAAVPFSQTCSRNQHSRYPRSPGRNTSCKKIKATLDCSVYWYVTDGDKWIDVPAEDGQLLATATSPPAEAPWAPSSTRRWGNVSAKVYPLRLALPQNQNILKAWGHSSSHKYHVVFL